ncbi:hypothetical protein [Flaviaesturariibacter amylovorans]|uniref:HK97 gp10 family phage protein n=1 Tax=Flaviaesturariibacter amylovorans TaxID=1084520 RepID=A0ABP8GPE2_9BACT
MTLDIILTAAQRINVEAAGREAVSKTTDELVRLNQAQLYQGNNSEGGKLGRYVNPSYARMKNGMNGLPGYGNKDLYLTGAYSRGIYAKVSGTSITMGSTDPKAEYLETGKNYGLFGESKRMYVDGALRTAFVDAIRLQMRP